MINYLYRGRVAREDMFAVFYMTFNPLQFICNKWDKITF
jgi:hypothetical protein